LNRYVQASESLTIYYLTYVKIFSSLCLNFKNKTLNTSVKLFPVFSQFISEIESGLINLLNVFFIY
jgi:hypothetical protein